jgi:hypothetical protein
MYLPSSNIGQHIINIFTQLIMCILLSQAELSRPDIGHSITGNFLQFRVFRTICRYKLQQAMAEIDRENKERERERERERETERVGKTETQGETDKRREKGRKGKIDSINMLSKTSGGHRHT